MKNIFLVLTSFLFIYSCKRCETCSNLCYECQYYDDERIEIYCSNEYPAFIDLEAFIGEINHPNDIIANCRALTTQNIKVCEKNLIEEYESNNYFCDKK